MGWMGEAGGHIPDIVCIDCPRVVSTVWVSLCTPLQDTVLHIRDYCLPFADEEAKSQRAYLNDSRFPANKGRRRVGVQVCLTPELRLFLHPHVEAKTSILNCHKQEEPKEIRQPNVLWYVIWDSATVKGH